MIISKQLLIEFVLLAFTVLVIVVWLLIAVAQFRLAMKSNDSKNDLRRAILIGLTSGGIYIAILVDLGVYLWLQTGTLLGATTSLMLLCLMPFVQIITVIGSLVQIRYSRKMSGYISFLGINYPSEKK